jgi:hypothetical protein
MVRMSRKLRYTQMRRRDLTPGEAAILAITHEGYGPRNTADIVLFTEADEAAVIVKTADGRKVLMANLTNLAAWRAEGEISDVEMKTKCLRIDLN